MKHKKITDEKMITASEWFIKLMWIGVIGLIILGMCLGGCGVQKKYGCPESRIDNKKFTA